MTDVKTSGARRRYDSTWRREGARRRRERVLDAAERQFLRGGYAATTIATVAAEAEVSVETIYKAFGGKPGLVKGIYERRLAGTGPVPAYERSDRMRVREADPRRIMREWGLLTAEVAEGLTPIRLLLREAAASDPEVSRVRAVSEEERLERMRHHAGFLRARGYLRPDVSVEEAVDVLWLCSSAEIYEVLVLQRGWSTSRFAGFLADLMISRLLAPSDG